MLTMKRGQTKKASRNERPWAEGMDPTAASQQGVV
jgi:hypothetical protein